MVCWAPLPLSVQTVSPPPSPTLWRLTARTRPGASAHAALCRPSRAPGLSARAAGSPPDAASQRLQAASQRLSVSFPRHTLGQCTKPCWTPCPLLVALWKPGRPVLSDLTFSWPRACTTGSPLAFSLSLPPSGLLPSALSASSETSFPCVQEEPSSASAASRDGNPCSLLPC